MTRLRITILALAALFMMAACSGKKQSTEQMSEEHDEAKAATEIKAFENVDAAVKAQFNGFLSDYYALNQSLINDNYDAAKAAASKMSETVAKFDMSKIPMGEQMEFYHTQQAAINSALKNIGQSGDIEEARNEIAPLSEALYALVKAYQPQETELYYQFCPMARNGEGANWLSSTKEISNPYMGQRMPKCGRTQEVIAKN
ncbi:MAG: DUF3347 domain-containing protein [Bacteroidetes bacterium]|nr:DUF3347 domain-containing protein [Bacteroidota bacterium]